MIHSTKKDQYWSFWYHWWSNHQDQDVLWGNRAVEAVEASEVAEAAEVHETAEVSKAQKITTEDFIGSCIHQFGDKNNSILMFCKKQFWQNHENPFWILAFFLSEAVEASLCYFFDNWLMETQISQPQEYTDAFKQNLTCIFLSVRAILKETFQCETPCNTCPNQILKSSDGPVNVCMHHI